MHQDPIEAVAPLTAAVAGFRDADDIDGEVAAIAAQGLVLWWANDPSSC